MLVFFRQPHPCLSSLLLILCLTVGAVSAAAATTPFSPLLGRQWLFTTETSFGPVTERFSFADQTAEDIYGVYLEGTRTADDGTQVTTFTSYDSMSGSFETAVYDAIDLGQGRISVEIYAFTLNGDTASGLYWINGIKDNSFTYLLYGPVPLTGSRMAPLDFTVSQMQGQAGLTVTFTAASGFSGWAWDFGDGTQGSGAATTHTYSTPGLYTVALTATPGSGPSQTVTKDNLMVVSDSRGQVPGNRYLFERAWPTLQQPWYFSSPRGLAMDLENHLYLADAWNSRVAKYTSDGQFITSFGGVGKGDGQFLEPAGVAVDNDGFIYVTDKCFDKNAGNNGAYAYDACRVQKFDRHGAFLASWRAVSGPTDLLKGPTGISVAPDGSLLVADNQNNRIVRFSGDGQLLGVLTGFASSNFSNPSAVLMQEDGSVFVLDSGNNQLHKFASFARDAWLASWDGLSTGKAMSSPAALASDRAGNLFITDFNHHRILTLNPQGVLATLIDQGQGTANGQFESPLGIVVDLSGHLYVDDYWGHRLQKFTASGAFLSAWASWGAGDGMLNGPHAIDVSPAGKVLVADAENFRIAAFDSEGRFQAAWGEKGAGNGQFGEWQGHEGPHAIAYSPGKILVADTLNDRIEEFDEQGVFIRQWGGFGSEAGKFKAPAGLTVDGANNLLVVEWVGGRVQKFDANGNFLGQWGSPGSGNGQFNSPHGIAVDRHGFVYVADTLNHRIQKFDTTGNYVGQWGGLGSGDGQLYQPWDVAVDSDGNLLVADTYNDRISRFTPQGVFLDHLGVSGTMPGQFRQPQGLAVGPDGALFIAEYFNNRVQKLKKVATPARAKAIIVAGGGPFRGNYLWDATRSSANLAYRALGFRGFNKESLRVLSADPGIDLDGNGQADDTAGAAGLATLRQMILDWGQESDSLLIYLVDHGGEESFRLNDHELLDAATLDSWLDQWQGARAGRVTVMIDACQSGSFITRLTPPSGKPRQVIASTQALESAYFINQGAISFSSFFWNHVFNGHDLGTSYALAAQAVTQATGDQHPLLDADGDGTGTSPADLAAANGVSIGSAGAISNQAPALNSVSASSETNGLLRIQAAVSASASGVARVWAVIRPPGYQGGTPASPVQSLPSVELIPSGNGLYSGNFPATSNGVYTVAVQAKDSLGNTTSPQLTQASVGGAMRRRAIIVGSGPATGPLWPAVRESARLAYQALTFQGYQAEDIMLLAPEAIPSLARQPLLPTPDNLQYGISTWANQETEDLVVFLVGQGDSEHFFLDQGAAVAAAALDQWLDSNTAAKAVTVVGDFSLAGDFLPRLRAAAGQSRILLSATAPGQAAHFLGNGDLSFSRFFWREIVNGRSVWDAFVEAKRGIFAATGVQTPWLNDTAIDSQASVGSLARFVFLGMGIRLAANDPQAVSASAEQTITTGSTATIFVDTVTASQPLTKVWAVISPPDTGQRYASLPGRDLPTVDLALTGPGHYQADWPGFTLSGRYGIAIHARSADGTVTLLKETSVRQVLGVDAHEADDTPQAASIFVLNDGPQHHTFHQAGDRDWTRFYGLASQTYDIRVSRAGNAADLVLTIYSSDGQTVLAGPVDDNGPGANELITAWTPPQDGLYLVELHHHDANAAGAGTEYDLEIATPTAPNVGIIEGIVLSSRDMSRLAGAIVLAGNASAITQSDGAFRLVTAAGSFTIQTTAANALPQSQPVTVTAGAVTQTSLALSALLTKGDVNQDGRLDFKDAILALRLAVNLPPLATVASSADSNGDGRVGMADLLYILQQLTR